MKTKSKSITSAVGTNTKGFALIMTISILVLLALIAIGLLSLSSVTIRSGLKERAQLEARANARLALTIAIGELQTYMGPDQRVSATAGILDQQPASLTIEGVEHPWWTAVWSTRWAGANGTDENVTPWVRNDERGGLSDRRFTGGFDRTEEVLMYLVSGNEGGKQQKGAAFLDAIDSILQEDEKVTMVSIGTYGTKKEADTTPKDVFAKGVNIRNDDRIDGRYAWWVGDMGVKANVGLVDRYSGIAPQRGGNSDGMERLMNPQDTGEEYMQGMNEFNDDAREKMFSEQTVSVPANIDKIDAQARFHDLTVGTRSVLTNVRQGGLQRDLTVYLHSPTGVIPDLRAQGHISAWGIDDTDKIIGPANEKVATEQGTVWKETKYKDIAPSFALLRKWYQIGQKIQFDALDHVALNPAPTKVGTDLRSMMNNNVNVYDRANNTPAAFLPHDEPNIAPVMAEGSIYYNLASYPDEDANGTVKHTLRICLYPRIALWNPYNVRLDLKETVAQLFVNGNKEVEVRYGERSRTQPRVVSIPFGRGSTRVGAKFDGVDKSPGHYVGTILFKLPKVSIAAGETVVFSPDKAAEYKIDNIYLNTLSPSVAPDPTKYYWADMSSTHSTAPEEFIEKPLGGNSSGGDNYLMCLKDASKIRGGQITDVLFDSLPQIVYANTSIQAGGGDEYPVRWDEIDSVPILSLESKTATLPAAAIPDVRTRDGFRFRWWQEHDSNIAGSGQLKRDPQHLQTAVIANWNPRAAYFSRSPWDNVTDVPPHFYGCYTRDLFDQAVSWQAMMPRAGANGNLVSSPFSPPSEGPEELVLFDIPRQETGIPSIAYLRHLKLSEFGWHPSYAVGNSLACPRTGRETTSPVLSARGGESLDNGWNQHLFGFHNSRKTYWAQLTREILFDRAEDHFVVYDLSYEANFNLWDNYFMSTGTPQEKIDFIPDPTENPLPNGRMALHATSDNLEIDINDFHRAATQLMIDGGFNIHSTSKEAWKAILATTGDTHYGSTGAIPFPRLLNPPQGEWLDADPTDKEATGGFRSLTEEELDRLAEEIVREVKERAPFFGLADFVNRRLVDSEHGDSEHGEMGPIAAAIEASGVNGKFRQEYPLDNEYELPNVSFYNMKDTTRLDQTLKPSSTAWGLPGYLTQGDVLQVIGSSLTPRSDTFMVRAYGESIDAQGEVQGQAWCEAVVQRTPEPINPDSTGVNPVKVDEFAGERNFGRKFRIVSFRWLGAKEI